MLSKGLFFYLARQEWADAWVGGGKVRIMPTCTWRDEERRGIQTPDEVLQLAARGLSPTATSLFGGPYPKGDLWTMAFRDSVLMTEDGQRIPLDGMFMAGEEDALALCTSRLGSRDLMARLSEGCAQKVAVIHIPDPSALLSVLNERLGRRGEIAPIRYTYGPDRDHVTKHMCDRWQVEVRLLWRNVDPEPVDVEIPGGLCSHVDLSQMPEWDPRTALAMHEIECEESAWRSFHHPSWIPPHAKPPKHHEINDELLELIANGAISLPRDPPWTPPGMFPGPSFTPAA